MVSLPAEAPRLGEPSIDAKSLAVQIPQDTFRLPRSKPIPKEKPKTRWQKFMEVRVLSHCQQRRCGGKTQERNMKKRKRSRLVWDEA